MLSNVASRNIFWVFGMTRPRIEPTEPLANHPSLPVPVSLSSFPIHCGNLSFFACISLTFSSITIIFHCHRKISVWSFANCLHREGHKWLSVCVCMCVSVCLLVHISIYLYMERQRDGKTTWHTITVISFGNRLKKPSLDHGRGSLHFASC